MFSPLQTTAVFLEPSLPLQKTTWLLLKGDADTRTNSPDLDSQSLSLSSGADHEPLQRTTGDSLYSREWLF